MRVGISGLGFYVPEKVLTNNELEKMVETSDEWIRTRTGISERRIAEKGTGTSDLAAFHHNGFWQPMDTLRDKRQLEALWNSGKAPWKVW